jgi:group I intron endonuclease
MLIIYKITNSINNKSYIGYTKHSLNTRWEQHVSSALKTPSNRKFYNAINKYGIDIWNREILLEVSNASTAKEKEIELIQQFNTYESGYNSTKGGDGNNGIIMSDESNLARSIALKGIPKSYNRMLNKKHAVESKQKISKAHLGMKKPWVKWTPEQCKKRGMTRRALTEKQYNTIHQLRKEGYTIGSISKDTGISTDLIRKWLDMDW